MSTKTSIKRIALVAVSALGFGMVSTVSANAAVSNSTLNARGVVATLSAGTSSSTAKVARVGVSYTIGVKATTIAGAADKDISLNAVFSQVPAGEAAYNVTATTASSSHGPSVTAKTKAQMETLGFAGSDATDGSGDDLTAVVDTDSSGSTPSFVTYEADTGEATKAVSTAAEIMTMTFTPSVAGTYKIFVWADDASGSTIQSFDGGEKSVVVTVVVGAVPASMTITQPTSSAATLTSDYSTSGALFIVSLKDAAGNPTTLNPTESITVAASAGTASDTSLTIGDFNSAGSASTVVYHDAAATVTVTFTAAGSLAGALATKTSTAVFTASSTAFNLDAGASVRDTSGFVAASGDDLADIDTTDIAYIATGKTSLTIRLPYATTTAAVSVAKITDTDGIITGVEGVSWLVPVSIAAADDYGTLVLSGLGSLADGESVAVEWQEAATVAITVTAQDRALTTTTLTPATVTAATGGTVVLTATAIDQFSDKLSGAVVAFSVSGRNTTSGATTNVLTNTDGKATYSLVDTSTSTTSLTSTVAASATYDGTTVAATSAAVTFGAYTVDSVAVTTPITSDSTATTSISTAVGGAQGSYATVTATLTSAAGALVGVPVVFTTSGLTGAGVVTDYSTTYTDANGVATSRIYSYATGTATVTATSGGKSATGTVKFVNASTDARTISVSVAGKLVTATVKDRYGNPVKSVDVKFTRTGVGYFGTGGSAVTVPTDANGLAEAVVVDATTDTVVTATLDNTVYSQVDDAAGYVGTTVVTATGTGASLAPAGIATASATVEGSSNPASDATDAANEATDAANAATDAANAAAEAADAATAAAQDAQAAVAELATKVASLMAGIKAQITTLTNLVIKIQKKVRA